MKIPLKKLCIPVFYIVMLLLSKTVYSNDTLHWSRLNVSYSGVTSYNSYVTAYGNGGCITHSNDDAHTWQRIQLANENETIVAVHIQSSTWYAVTTSGNLISSETLWRTRITTQLRVQGDVIGFSVDTIGNVFVCTKIALYKYSKSLVLIDSLRIPYNSIVEYNSSARSNYMTLSAKNGLLYVINNSPFGIDKVISFQSLGICTSCTEPTSVLLRGDTIYTKINGAFAVSYDNGLTWNILIKTGVLNSFSIVQNSEGSLCFVRTKIINQQISYSIPQYAVKFQDTIQIISDTTKECYTKYLFLINSCSKGKDTIFSVGWDNTIVMSPDFGKTWRTISNFAPYYYGMWADEKHGYMGGFYGRVFRTLDSGATWLPQIYSYDIPTTTVNMIAIDSSGKGIVGAGNSTMFTTDYGSTFRYDANSKVSTSFYRSKFFRLSSNEYVLFNVVKQGRLSYLKRYLFTSDLNLLENNTLIYTDLIDITLKENDTIDAWFLSSMAEPTLQHQISTNKGATWEVLKEISVPLSSVDNIVKIGEECIAVHNVDYTKGTAYTSDAHVMSVNLTNSSWYADSLYLTDNVMYYFFKLGNQILGLVFPTYTTLTSYRVAKFTSLSYLSDFIVDSSNGSNGPTTLVSSIPNACYLSTLVSQGNWVYKLTLHSIGTVNVEDFQRKEAVLTVSPPFPNPTANSVSVNLFWDTDKEFSIKSCSIVNSLGVKVQGYENITLHRKTPFNVEVVWDGSTLSQGLYYIFIQHNSIHSLIPVIVLSK